MVTEIQSFDRIASNLLTLEIKKVYPIHVFEINNFVMFAATYPINNQ